MHHRDLILELLDDVFPNHYCDDCISSELDIQPRQQVNQICRGLEAARQIHRAKSPCAKCGRTKTTNGRGPLANDGPTRKTEPLESMTSTRRDNLRDVDIEKTRTEVVGICRALWQSTQAEP